MLTVTSYLLEERERERERRLFGAKEVPLREKACSQIVIGSRLNRSAFIVSTLHDTFYWRQKFLLQRHRYCVIVHSKR